VPPLPAGWILGRSISVTSWHNTVSAATPTRVTQIGAMSWTADGRTVVADYLWEPEEGSPDLAVLGLDATSSGGSPQAHSRLLFSQGARCTVCVYTAFTNSDGSTLTAVAETSCAAAPEPPRTALVPPAGAASFLGHRADQRHLVPLGPSVGSYEGLVPVLSTDGQAQHWLLCNDPEQFGWISGGKLVPLPMAPSGVLAIDW
jgi:hypothetical protein